MPSPAFLRARKRVRSWRSLAASLLVHLGLVFAACWVVFRSPRPPASRPEGPAVFVAPSAEGGAGAREHAVQARPKPNFLPRPRIAVNKANASLALPALPAAGGSSLGMAAGTKGGGLGNGFGAGQGKGFGGPGATQRFVGKPVMGALIRAQRVAVYLDCSGSMRPYLARVAAEIRKQYPDADVFQFDGARVVAVEDHVAHGRSFHGEPPRLTEAPTRTVMAELTPAGRQLQARLRSPCEKGSLGAWIDRLLVEPYDALVVFSDFQDGVRLYEAKKGEPKLVYSDSSYHKVGGAQKGHARWQREWLEAFGKAPQGAGPRLYLFTVQQEPQAFLQACVAASGGSSTSVSWLRKGGRKAP